MTNEGDLTDYPERLTLPHLYSNNKWNKYHLNVVWTRSGLDFGSEPDCGCASHKFVIWDALFIFTWNNLILYFSYFYRTRNLCQNLNMFLPAIEHQNHNTSEWFILIISYEKKENNNLIIVILLLEIQNSCQNQAMIIYGEEMPNLKLDYFTWTKSEYLTAYCWAQISNFKF